MCHLILVLMITFPLWYIPIWQKWPDPFCQIFILAVIFAGHFIFSKVMSKFEHRAFENSQNLPKGKGKGSRKITPPNFIRSRVYRTR